MESMHLISPILDLLWMGHHQLMPWGYYLKSHTVSFRLYRPQEPFILPMNMALGVRLISE